MVDEKCDNWDFFVLFNAALDAISDERSFDYLILLYLNNFPKFVMLIFYEA